MSIVYPEPTVLIQPGLTLSNLTSVPSSLYQCLVVSVTSDRQEIFEGAAEEAGWQVRLCGSSSEAYAAIDRHHVYLAVVDLITQDGALETDLRGVAEALSRDRDVLLMISGTEEDPLEEIWARQLGCWLYLPDVDETCDVATLCSEARKVTEKLHGSEITEASDMGLLTSGNL